MIELGHVVYNVRELAKSLKFYHGTQGLELSGTLFNGRTAILTDGLMHHELLLIEVGQAEGHLNL